MFFTYKGRPKLRGTCTLKATIKPLHTLFCNTVYIQTVQQLEASKLRTNT